MCKIERKERVVGTVDVTEVSGAMMLINGNGTFEAADGKKGTFGSNLATGSSVVLLDGHYYLIDIKDIAAIAVDQYNQRKEESQNG